MATPAIPSRMLRYSFALTLRFIQTEVNMLINSGFNAIASVVIPAATDSNAKMNSPRYNAVLKRPNTDRSIHSLPIGRRYFSIPCTYPSSSIPAMRNRMQKKVSASTDCKPNFPAMEAEAQRIAKVSPVR